MLHESQNVPYEIVHSTLGRIRLRIPQLKNSEDYANRLQQKIASHVGVTEVRLNAAASSVVISYRPRIISADAIQAQLDCDIQQAGTISSATPETKPVAEPPAFVDATEVVEKPPVEEPSVLQTVDSPGVCEPAISQQAEILSDDPTEDAGSETSDHIAANQTEAEPGVSSSPTELKTEPELESDATSPPPKIAVKASTNPTKSKGSIKPKGLSQRMLSKRLHVSGSSLRQQRTQSDFAVWSAAKDPDGKSWQYDSQSGYFYPVTPGE